MRVEITFKNGKNIIINNGDKVDTFHEFVARLYDAQNKNVARNLQVYNNFAFIIEEIVSIIKIPENQDGDKS